MSNHILQLYPASSQVFELEGLYLEHDVRGESKPFVYANFVTSLDGRIAIPHPTKDGMVVPANVANERDWRLFQELAAQADIIISSGRYLRDWADGRAQEILRTDDPKFADLKVWRAVRGLSSQPDIAIVSNSLDFPIPDVLTKNGRRVVVFTSGEPDGGRVAEIEENAGIVVNAGKNGVNGKKMVETLAELGYQTIYSGAGPKILHLLLTSQVLNRLYLTQVPRLLGGDPFSSIVEGNLFNPAPNLKLNTIYHDPTGVDGLGQLFLSYDIDKSVR